MDLELVDMIEVVIGKIDEGKVEIQIESIGVEGIAGEIVEVIIEEIVGMVFETIVEIVVEFLEKLSVVGIVVKTLK